MPASEPKFSEVATSKASHRSKILDTCRLRAQVAHLDVARLERAVTGGFRHLGGTAE